MGNNQSKEEDQLTDSDAVCPSQFGANNKQNQEENQLTDSVMWIDESILDNNQINLEGLFTKAIRFVSWFLPFVCLLTETGSEMQRLHL